MNDDNEVADAIEGVAYALKLLGNADASTPMGAIEALGMAIKEGLIAISTSIDELAEAQGSIARAMWERNEKL